MKSQQDSKNTTYNGAQQLDEKIKEKFKDKGKEQLKGINTDCGTTMLAPERTLQIAQSAWWSEEVHRAHLLVKYLKIAISQQRNNFQDDD
eukprot:8001808-Ditylum_brightwellii.AAC.1